MDDIIQEQPPVEQPSAEEIARSFSALLDSAGLVNDVIAGTEAYASLPDEEKKSAVERNVGHMEYMKTKPYWTSEDFSGVDAATTAGKAYIA